MTDPASSMFYAAPFGADGELIGVGQWRLSQLSPRWLEFCRQFLVTDEDYALITELRNHLAAAFLCCQ